MKYQILALACSVMLTACGGSEESSAPSAPTLAGLWQTNSISDADTNTVVPLAPGQWYFLFENTNDNPIDLVSYSNIGGANCLTANAGKLTHIGNNQYRDRAGDVVRITIIGNSLSFSLPPDNNRRFNATKVTGLSKADLQVCDLQSGAAISADNEEAPKGIYQTIFTISSQQQ